MRRRCLFILIFVLWGLVSCGSEVPEVPVDEFAENGFPFELVNGAFTLGPLSSFAGGEGAFKTPFAFRSATEEVMFILGYYGFEEDAKAWVSANIDSFDGRLIKLSDGGSVELRVEGDHALSMTVSAPPGNTRSSVAFKCRDDDYFLGFGAQTDALEHRGHRVPIWVSEQGIGKDHQLEELPFPMSFAGRQHDSYFPVPFFLSPAGYGVLVEGTERIVFDLCSTQKDAWSVESWAPSLKLVLFSGDTPIQVLERATAWMGRPPMPPAWASLPWISIKGGESEVRKKAHELRDHEIPAAAVWSEDWLGASINPYTGNNIKYHWEWDPELYPTLPQLIDELHAMDLKFMGYFNPFVTDEFSEWNEALEGGFLPTTPEGKAYEFPILTKNGSVVDLTNSEARDWLRQHMQDARDLGLDGWMADYAEWVPFDAHFADGRSGAQVSSEYPLLWQQVNAEVCNGECLFFVRSGFTGSSGIVPAAWGGDQNTDFGEDDGLPTALRIGVGLGLAGVAFYGSDIAGYTSAINDPSTKELYFRWTQLGAFSPIMRTHEGNKGPENWNYDKDEETLAHFKQYAEIHTQLFPMWRSLLKTAHLSGVPVIRHPALHYPKSASMLTVRDSYLLGDAMYVAPVVSEGAIARTVALPPGQWVDWNSGLRHEGESSLEVTAPLDTVPVFVREGAVIPMLANSADGPTTAQSNNDSYLSVTLVPGADGRFELEDGTVLAMTSNTVDDPGELGFPQCNEGNRPCTELKGKRRLYRLNGAALQGDSWSFEVKGDPHARTWDLMLFVP